MTLAPDLGTLSAAARRLAADVDELTGWWGVVEEADATLGAEVQDKGERLMLLAEQLAAVTASAQAAELRELAARLSDAIGRYGALAEHETGASMDIFDQLGPGAALAQRTALLTVGAAQRVAAGGNDSIDAAVWAVTRASGYRRGLSDARNGEVPRPAEGTEGYRDGYAAGWRWGASHPSPPGNAGGPAGSGTEAY